MVGGEPDALVDDPLPCVKEVTSHTAHSKPSHYPGKRKS